MKFYINIYFFVFSHLKKFKTLEVSQNNAIAITFAVFGLQIVAIKAFVQDLFRVDILYMVTKYGRLGSFIIVILLILFTNWYVKKNLENINEYLDGLSRLSSKDRRALRIKTLLITLLSLLIPFIT